MYRTKISTELTPLSMINRIIDFSINNKFIIGLLTLALIGAGIYSMTQVPIDAVPDITNNQVQVITQSLIWERKILSNS